MNHTTKAREPQICSWSRAETRLTSTTPRISFRAAGRDEELPLVLLHSMAVDQSTWGPAIQFLENRHRVVTLDTRGHGASGSADQAHPQDWAGDIVAVLDALGIDTAVLVGVSMGGIQAIATAAAAPNRVAGIVVADSFAALPAQTAAARIDGLTEYASIHSMDEVATKYVEDTFLADADTRGPELVRTAMEAMTPHDYQIAVRACFGADVRADLDRVQAPTLVLWGEQDTKTPRPLSETIAAGIAEARLQTIPGAAHLSHLDQPGHFASLVSDFVADLPPR